MNSGHHGSREMIIPWFRLPEELTCGCSYRAIQTVTDQSGLMQEKKGRRGGPVFLIECTYQIQDDQNHGTTIPVPDRARDRYDRS